MDPNMVPMNTASPMDNRPTVAETGKPSAMIWETVLSRNFSDGPRSNCARSTR